MNVNESFLIGTTRFNNDTYQENLDWRNKHKHSGCIYPLNKSIAYTIPPNILICVLEMNNSQNKIMGIGLIRNSYDKINHEEVDDNKLPQGIRRGAMKFKKLGDNKNRDCNQDSWGSCCCIG